MTAIKTEKCACVVWMKHGIEYCSLHKAAPDLLEACKHVIDEIDCNDFNGGISFATLKCLRAAITEADGRQ